MNPIIQAPDQRLHQKCIRVTDFAEAEKITEELIKVTKTVDRPWKLWQGMAANQVGFNKRIILLKETLGNYLIIVNPEVLEEKWLVPLVIGCYSVKGKFLAKYHLYFKIKYQNLKGEYHIKTLIGGKAATLQQELDHLDGILISDKGTRIF